MNSSGLFVFISPPSITENPKRSPGASPVMMSLASSASVFLLKSPPSNLYNFPVLPSAPGAPTKRSSLPLLSITKPKLSPGASPVTVKSGSSPAVKSITLGNHHLQL